MVWVLKVRLYILTDGEPLSRTVYRGLFDAGVSPIFSSFAPVAASAGAGAGSAPEMRPPSLLLPLSSPSSSSSSSSCILILLGLGSVGSCYGSHSVGPTW